jgi:hypothetical protein
MLDSATTGAARSTSTEASLSSGQVPRTPKRREEYRERVNDLLGTSPAALSKLPDLAEELKPAPIGPNSLSHTA